MIKYDNDDKLVDIDSALRAKLQPLLENPLDDPNKPITLEGAEKRRQCALRFLSGLMGKQQDCDIDTGE